MLSLTAAHEAEFGRLAEAAFPAEACALLVGTIKQRHGHGDGLVELQRIVPTANVAAHPLRGFEIDPAAHIALLRDLREGHAVDGVPGPGMVGPSIVGHWHSHPNGRPEPSATDAAMIHDPGLVWLISAVDADGRARPPRAFRPRPDGRFADMIIETRAAGA